MPKYDLEINNGYIVTSHGLFKGSVLVKDGMIVGITRYPVNDSTEKIDADGLYVFPGMVDEHVHFMDPCEQDREDFIHGSMAAAIAGVTTVVEHTHACPVRTVEEFERKKEYLRNRSVVDFGLAAHVWPESIREIRLLWERGISLFKIFTTTTHGVPGLSNYELYRAFSEIASAGGVALIHAEDDSIVRGSEASLRSEGRKDPAVMHEWRSKIAEETAVANISMLAELTGAKITIAHVSHPKVVEIVETFKRRGADIWVETCPQYMFLNDEMISEKGQLLKFTPPARSRQETAGMLELLRRGKIDIIASDHAPSTKEQKMRGDIWEALFGLPGIQTTLPLMLTLANQGKVSLNTLVKVYSENPARRLGLYPRKGSISLGADADLVIVDMNEKWVISDEWIVSKARWSPYSGIECFGKPVMTLVRGKVVMEKSKITVDPGWGRYVERVSEPE